MTVPAARSTRTRPPAFTDSVLIPRRLASDKMTTSAGGPAAAKRSNAAASAAGSATPLWRRCCSAARTAVSAHIPRAAAQTTVVHVVLERMTNLQRKAPPGEVPVMLDGAADEDAGMRQGVGRFDATWPKRLRLE